MTTLVGTQSKLEDAIISLIELEYDAIGAYKLAVDKITNLTYKNSLSDFLQDHERHLMELKEFCTINGYKAPKSGDLMKGLMAKIKVAIGNLTNSDLNILRAMLDNELDTNTAYERMVNHPEKPFELDDMLQKAFRDEKKHKAWLEGIIEQNK